MVAEAEIVDPDRIEYSFECLKAQQPIGDVFLAKIPFNDLINITYFDVRRMLHKERPVETYMGIQRPLIKKRVEGLEEYVNFFDASFPTAIIIAVDEAYAEYDEVKKQIVLSNVPRDGSVPNIAIRNIARVLDGQHRIAGLRKFHGDAFDLPVTLFVGADIADQAHVFATVNLEQQKVNKSLAYDLYSLATSRSPQKTCHNIAVVLDQDEKSPMYRRIKRLGVATFGRGFEPLSQATFVDALMPYISLNPKIDRDRLLKAKRLEKIDAKGMIRCPFRNMFIEERDVDIVSIIFDYFTSIKERWPIAWASNDRGLMLNRTNGFRAFMRLYSHLYELSGSTDGVVTRAFMEEFMARVRLEDRDFNTENFKPGTSGESSLLTVLRDTR